jgi:hypothetical protein
LPAELEHEPSRFLMNVIPPETTPPPISIVINWTAELKP